MPKVIATKTTAVRRTKANEKRTTKLLTSGPTHSRHVTKIHGARCRAAVHLLERRARVSARFRAVTPDKQTSSGMSLASHTVTASRYLPATTS